MLGDRLLKGDFGVFNHYLFGDKNWVRTTNALDIERLARNLSKIGASRYFITLMQGNRYMLAPNRTYDEIAGTKPGEACAIRDIPLELGLELKKYGIDMYLYYTGDGPHFEPEIGPRFGITEPRRVTAEFVGKWAAVLREYSVRYGELVKGWWIDGCYEAIGYTEELMVPLYDACKAGNPDCIVALNGGVYEDIKKHYSREEFTCGEFNDFTFVPTSGIIDGARAHILAPLGISPDGSEWNSWAKPGLKRDADYLADYIRRLKAVGCALTIDIIIYPDGTFDASQFNELCKLSDMLK
ncbi:MAG: hypothetical protein ACI4XJ_09880 [Eubacteriales bacterium]